MKLFRQGIKTYLITIILIGVSWTLAVIALMNFYGLGISQATIESIIQTCSILTGSLLLGNIFNFYIPQKGQLWIGIALPLIFAGGLTAAGYFLISWINPNQTDFIEFLKNNSFLKGTYFYLVFQFWTILLLIAGKLEDQEKIKETETNSVKLAKEAEMYYLRQQLQPHFLFNSLNSISALVKSQPDQAREMVVELADFLRGTIRKDNNQWISMEEELVQIEKFLYIEKVRFGSRLEVLITLDDQSKNQKIPQLMIQPLLENAIKHGLYGLTGIVPITLSISTNESTLLVEIQNPYDPKVGQAKGSGFGLEAVNRRLQLLFGRSDLLKIQKSDNAFKVELTIPLYTNENNHN